MEIFKGVQFQRGYGQRGSGLGGLLNKFMKFVVPHAQDYLPNVIDSASKSLDKNLPKLVDSGISALTDAIINKKKSKNEINELNELKTKENLAITPVAQEETKQKYLSRGDGLKSSIKRKRNNNSYIILKNKKKSREKDIFDLNKLF